MRVIPLALLFSVKIGAAAGDSNDMSIETSRYLLFKRLCDGEGPRNNGKKCGKVIGVGFCFDSTGQFFDFCQDASPGKTSGECQTDAESSPKAVGFAWDQSSSACILFFDNKDSKSNVGLLCPDGFSTGLSQFTGTGFPKSANANSIYTCYSCES